MLFAAEVTIDVICPAMPDDALHWGVCDLWRASWRIREETIDVNRRAQTALVTTLQKVIVVGQYLGNNVRALGGKDCLGVVLVNDTPLD